MPISYLELERLAPQGGVLAVPEDGAVEFDSVVSSEGTMISYDMAGTLTFNDAGYYYIDWYVAPQFGLTTDGSNWAIRTAIGGLEFIGSSHTKVSATIGFAIFNAAAGETARLVNVSDGAITLSEAVLSKAGLIVYNVATQFTS